MNEKFDPIKEQEISNFLVENFGYEVFSPGLERTKNLFLPIVKKITQKGIRITTITGTNGKGQTAHSLAYLLNRNNQSYALWTSPHILSIRERFNFGEPGEASNIGYSELSQKINESKDFINKNYPDLKISYYEFLFYVFLNLTISSKRNVEYLILEVGLGGRLDAVNHLDAEVVALTSISRDHQLILGNRYDLILNEKLGVCRDKSKLISNISLDYLKDKIHYLSKTRNIEWINHNSTRNYFRDNQLLSFAIFQHYFPNIEMQLNFPIFKGRHEKMSFKGKTIIFIGAHNIDGVRSMVQSKLLDQAASDIPIKVLLSFSKRSYEELNIMLKLLLGFKGIIYKVLLTTFHHEKAVDVKLINLLFKENLKFNEGLLGFVENWKEELLQSNNEKILVCGSYYFIGEVQRFIHTNL
jgi:dihydrofolate synthase/folylpolyglutamate synthase